MISGICKRAAFLLLLGAAFTLQAQVEMDRPVPRQGNDNLFDNQRNKDREEKDKDTNTKSKEYTGKGSIVVDDSTRNVYGPKTSKWITEKEIFYNKKEYKLLDTTLINMHRWNYVQRFEFLYHDLGNVGTALNPVFPSVSSQIGASTGFHSYQPYYDTEEPIYFDTKSAYSSFYIVWGGNGRAFTKIKFSRNITPRWNFGFDYRPMFVDKQIQRERKGDRQIVSHYYDFYTTYFSKNKKYHLLASFRRFRHVVEENGGIAGSDSLKIKDYFPEDENKIRNTLLKAQTEEFRRIYHFWHQYSLTRGFQLYQSMDQEKIADYFRDKTAEETNYKTFFKQTLITPGTDSVVVTDKMALNYTQLETGVKGNLAFLFYNFFHRIRRYEFQSAKLANYDIGNNYWGTENTLGSRINFRIDSLTHLRGTAEYLLPGRYSINAQFESRWLDAKLTSALAKPGFMPQYYKGSHDFWIQSFHNTFSNQLEGMLKFDHRLISLKAGVNYTTFANRIYFAMMPAGQKNQPELIRPYQSKGTQQYLSPKVDFTLPIGKKFKFRGQGIYTQITANSDELLQMPKIFINGQFCYEHWMFKNAIFVQAGIDAHRQSAYYAYGYAPTIQQFYRQTKFKTPDFTMVDLFINGQFKRGRFFLKWHNFLQTGRIALSQYIPTPHYRGMGSVVDFGFDLYLFD